MNAAGSTRSIEWHDLPPLRTCPPPETVIGAQHEAQHGHTKDGHIEDGQIEEGMKQRTTEEENRPDIMGEIGPHDKKKRPTRVNAFRTAPTFVLLSHHLSW